MNPDDTAPCGVPAIELGPEDLEPCPPTLPAPPTLPPLAPWSAEDLVTEADHAAAGIERRLPLPTDAAFTPGAT